MLVYSNLIGLLPAIKEIYAHMHSLSSQGMGLRKRAAVSGPKFLELSHEMHRREDGAVTAKQ